MRSFSKTLAATLGFLACLTGLYVLLTWPYLHGDFYAYEDAAVRDSLAGSLDTLLTGASHGYCAFDPVVYDECCGTSSYNLSGSLMTLGARRTLLAREVARNPVKTVYIELSFNTLTRDRRKEGVEGDLYALPRMGGLRERLAFFFEAFSEEEYLCVCADTLTRGWNAWGWLLRGGGSELDPAARGCLRRESVDLSVTAEEFAALHHTRSIEVDALWRNKGEFWEMVESCQAQGIDVVLVTTPLADRCIASYDNLEVAHDWYVYYARKYGCEFYDFNLYRGRDALLPEDTAFYDEYHLSASGASVFTQTLADLHSRARAGEDLSGLFYATYDELDEVLCRNYAMGPAK